MCAPGENADADDVDVLLDGGLDHFLRRAVQARVDDVQSRVAQRARHDLDAAVVAVEPDLGDEDAYGLTAGIHARKLHALAHRPEGPGPGDTARFEFNRTERRP